MVLALSRTCLAFASFAISQIRWTRFAALQDQFYIDEKNSVDKRKALGDREFGYLSLHRIAMVSPQRGKLIEYLRFKDEPFEIQIRSILQHAWAEIEHDLG